VQGKAKGPVIAIDGPSGAGKSTIAKMLARRLGVAYLDTGAMYRAVALLTLRSGLQAPFDDQAAARVALLAREHRIEVIDDHGRARVFIDGEDVTGSIRTPECSAMSSAVSALSAVREALVPVQRAIGEKGGVMEGRDMGSVVFPDADLKVFLTASTLERARRRHSDLVQAGTEATLKQVLDQQRERDHRDSTRSDSPLKVAEGAVVVDTTGMTLAEVVERLLVELDKATERESRGTE
jgi:cytidylate kinase